MSSIRSFLGAALLAFAGPALAQAASTGSGQAYPSRPVKIIVPFTAGSATDILARVVGEYLRAQRSASPSWSRTSPARAASSAPSRRRARRPTATR